MIIKKISIFNWQYYLILSLAGLFIITIITMFMSPNANSDNLNQIGLIRLGLGFGLLISFILDYNKNRIHKIIIDENFLIFEIVKNFKKSIIQISRKDITSCKMNIYTKDNQRINLCFDMCKNKTVEFIDIYHNEVSLYVIKQLFTIKEYLTNFSYEVFPESKHIISFIENGMKCSSKDKIYNILISTAIVIGFILTIFCIINI